MFLLAVKNTCRYMLVTVPVTLGAAVGLSVVLRHVARGVTFLRLSFLYPMIMPIASIVLAVQFFCGDSGFLNRVLTLTGMQGADWLHTSAAFWILCVLYFWRFIGYYVLIYFAKLQMIPGEYYEYAALYGAGEWQKFRFITWPLLIPAVLFTLVLSVMNAFRCYREAFLLGGNYPDDSIYLLQHFMNNNIRNLNYQKISAAAVSIVVMLLLVSAAGYAVYRLVKRRRAYG